MAYRMAGGAPASIIGPPGEALCFATSTIIKIMTRSGNSNTTPSGTDILELPFKRILLLKKANVGVKRSFSLLSS